HAAFADRLTVKQVDGRPIGGWFSEDFTLAELARLRARERVPDIRPANRVYDDAESIPTLAQVIDLVRAMETRGAGRAGLYVELKHPTYFATEGRRLDGSPIAVDLVGLLLEALSEAGFVAGDRLFVQCFEVAPLIEFEDRQTARGWDIPLIQLFGDVDNRSYRAAPWDMVSRARRADTAVYGVLATLIRGGITEGVSYADLAAPEVLAHLRQRYAAGIGPPRQNVLLTVPGPEGGPDLFTGTPSPLLGHARQLGLLVHPYTLRAEAPFLLERQGRLVTVQEEALALLDAGVDGFFIDQPDEGRLAVLRHRTALERSPPL
ncbi:MAG TPA: glycerophosphodiester phosphodiesterase family protein, partial [Pseudomonadales bacterium]